MRTVFMGTPQIAVPFLDTLIENKHVVSLAVTGPDMPAGRGGRIRQSPVKARARKLGIPVFQPHRLGDDEVHERLSAQEADLFVIVAFRILPARLIELPRLGCLNVHASLLPKYRGAAPIAWALINGESETGVTTMLIDAGVDTGGILLQERCRIEPDDDAPSLTGKLVELGVRVMTESIERLSQGSIQPTPQDHSASTGAPKLTKEHGRIDWRKSATEIHNLRRGHSPWPGTYTFLRAKCLKVHGTLPLEPCFSGRQRPEGQVLEACREGLRVQCGEHSELLLTEVQPEGRRRMNAEHLVMGRYLHVGDCFE